MIKFWGTNIMDINKQFLSSISACEPQLRLFKVIFPEGCVLTADNLIKAEKGGLNVTWLISQLMPTEKHVEFAIWCVNNVMGLNTNQNAEDAFIISKKWLLGEKNGSVFKSATTLIKQDEDKKVITRAGKIQRLIILSVLKLNKMLANYDESKVSKQVEQILKYTTKASILSENIDKIREKALRRQQFEKMVELVEVAQS
jgi:hypothetical protein